MSLRQLAGPFTITNVELGINAVAVDYWFWHPRIGIISDVNFGVGFEVGGTFYRCTISLDGHAHEAGGDAISDFVTAYGWGWWESARRMVILVLGVTIEEWAYDTKALIRERITNGFTALMTAQYVKLRDRWVRYSSGIQEMDAAGVIIRSSPAVSGIASATVGPGRKDGEVFVGETARKCFFWDVAKQEVTSITMWVATVADAILYAPEHGIIVSLHTNGALKQLKIWSLEVKPFDVTDPVIIAGVLQAGSVVTYRTQVLGDQGEACVGQLVDWTLTGAGTLLAPQSRTDSSGYATVQVSYGVLEGDLVSTLKAGVKC